jgi:hypothetical protein
MLSNYITKIGVVDMTYSLPTILEKNVAEGIIHSRNTAELLESRLEFLDGKERVIMAMSIKGATFRQIAALTGVHEASVARQVRKLSYRLLRGAFVECLQKRDWFTKEQLAIAKDRYLVKLPLVDIAKKRNCTLYHVRLVLSQLAQRCGSARSKHSLAVGKTA